MGQPLTGRPFDIAALDLCRCDGGQVVEHWGVMDQLSMLQQLGLVPPGPAASERAPADETRRCGMRFTPALRQSAWARDEVACCISLTAVFAQVDLVVAPAPATGVPAAGRTPGPERR